MVGVLLGVVTDVNAKTKSSGMLSAYAGAHMNTRLLVIRGGFRTDGCEWASVSVCDLFNSNLSSAGAVAEVAGSVRVCAHACVLCMSLCVCCACTHSETESNNRASVAI